MQLFPHKEKQLELVFDYILLLAILAGSLLVVKILGLHDRTLLAVTIPLSIGYVIWGTYHHQRHGHIDRKIFMEYFGLAALVNVIIGILVL